MCRNHESEARSLSMFGYCLAGIAVCCFVVAVARWWP